MDPLEKLLRPLTTVLNRNISETTPARELCQRLDGKTVAIRVRDTALAMYFEISDEVLTLKTDFESDPDVILTGSLLTLARMAGPKDESAGEVAVRDGALDIQATPTQHSRFRNCWVTRSPTSKKSCHTLSVMPRHIGQARW